MRKLSDITAYGWEIDMVAAAVIGGTVIGVGASMASSNQQSKAAQGAANAQVRAQKETLAEQEKLSAPYRALGESALPQLEKLLGIGGASPEIMQNALAASPGYQFALQQGLQGTKSSANASGMALSGNTLKALEKYGTGLADQTYQTQVANLKDVTGMGQAAAAGQAANAGVAGREIGNAQAGYYTNLGNINSAEVSGISNALQSAISQGTTQSTLKDIYGSGRSDGTIHGATVVPQDPGPVIQV
jgi:hypothetical protein